MKEPAKIVMYGTALCPYCAAARMLFTKKKVAYEDISVSGSSKLRAEMERLSGRRTVPQIFINDEAVGGFDDIYALDQQGKLDSMLGIAD